MDRLRILVASLSVLFSVPLGHGLQNTVNSAKLQPCQYSIFLLNLSVNNEFSSAQGFCKAPVANRKASLTGANLPSAGTNHKLLNLSLHITNKKMDIKPSNSSNEHEKDSNHLYKSIIEEGWKFTSSEFLTFPLDTVLVNYVRRNVPNAVFSIVEPKPFEGQTLLAGISPSALELIDLHPVVAASSLFRDFASGAWRHPASTPVAHRYGGYQFGWWAEQLGDGRAHLLGHYTNRKGEWWELQLKGSGKTPYSRNGDGRAVVRSSVREFLAAEAMDALGFRTSRCASLVVGEELAIRDQFYNGSVKLEKTAIVLRLAPTWFRFGSLEILSKRNEVESLNFLVEHVISKHFKTIPVTDPDRYLSMFSAVVDETAEMIAQWQSVGFTHGVMNTDNMSIMSLTIDYGPFGFLDAYNPNFIPNSSDNEGLYRYQNQPQIGYNNLQRLSNTLLQLLTREQKRQIKTILDGYNAKFKMAYLNLFSKKLGLQRFKQEDEELINILLNVMKVNEADFTMTFWELGNLTFNEIETKNLPKKFWALSKIVMDDNFHNFVNMYKARLQDEESTDDIRQRIMATTNPKYILRNWIAQEVIEKVEHGDFDDLYQVLKVLRNPFQTQEEAEKKGYADAPPDWSQRLRVSCSS